MIVTSSIGRPEDDISHGHTHTHGIIRTIIWLCYVYCFFFVCFGFFERRNFTPYNHPYPHITYVSVGYILNFSYIGNNCCIFIILRHNVLLFFPFVVSSISAGVLNIWLLQFIVFFFSFKFLSIPFSRITWMLMWKLCAFAHSGWCCACCSIIILTHTYIFPLSFLSLSMFVLLGLWCWIAQLIAYNYNSFIQILLLYKYTEQSAHNNRRT